MMAVIGLLHPPIVARDPPITNRAATRDFILPHHTPVIEGIRVVAPTTFAPFGRSEIATCSTTLRHLRQFWIHGDLRRFGLGAHLLWARFQFAFDRRWSRRLRRSLRPLIRRLERLRPAPAPAGERGVFRRRGRNASGWLSGAESFDVRIAPGRCRRHSVRARMREELADIVDVRRTIFPSAPSLRRLARARPLLQIGASRHNRSNLVFIERSWCPPRSTEVLFGRQRRSRRRRWIWVGRASWPWRLVTWPFGWFASFHIR